MTVTELEFEVNVYKHNQFSLGLQKMEDQEVDITNNAQVLELRFRSLSMSVVSDNKVLDWLQYLDVTYNQLLSALDYLDICTAKCLKNWMHPAESVHDC